MHDLPVLFVSSDCVVIRFYVINVLSTKMCLVILVLAPNGFVCCPF